MIQTEANTQLITSRSCILIFTISRIGSSLSQEAANIIGSK